VTGVAPVTATPASATPAVIELIDPAPLDTESTPTSLTSAAGAPGIESTTMQPAADEPSPSPTPPSQPDQPTKPAKADKADKGATPTTSPPVAPTMTTKPPKAKDGDKDDGREEKREKGS